ncbi:MAG: DinB family protein, partial [Caldilineaceae bacterium]|nr:DinB family protein [Caldilineaceae bacterium]
MRNADGIAERLQAAYDKLCTTFALLDGAEIEHGRMAGGWTPKALMAHVAFWDDYQTRRMQAAVQGLSAAAGCAAPTADNDERARFDSERSWATVLAEADSARHTMIEFARTLDDQTLAAAYAEGERTLVLVDLLEHMIRHTRLHAQELQDYCGSMLRWSKPALRIFIMAQHNHMMESISRLSEKTIVSTIVCGTWSMRDVLVHILSWQEYQYSVLKQWPDAAHEALTPWLDGNGIDAINANLLANRADLNMIDICDGLMTYHRRMLRYFDSVNDEQLAGLGDY